MIMPMVPITMAAMLFLTLMILVSQRPEYRLLSFVVHWAKIKTSRLPGSSPNVSMAAIKSEVAPEESRLETTMIKAPAISQNRAPPNGRSSR